MIPMTAHRIPLAKANEWVSETYCVVHHPYHPSIIHHHLGFGLMICLDGWIDWEVWGEVYLDYLDLFFRGEGWKRGTLNRALILLDVLSVVAFYPIPSHPIPSPPSPPIPPNSYPTAHTRTQSRYLCCAIIPTLPYLPRSELCIDQANK